MSKGLEALKDLENHFKTSSWAKETDFTMICFEIEKELKALEILKKEPYIAVNWYLEGTYEEYKNAIEKVKITEEEWSFAKEVLL